MHMKHVTVLLKEAVSMLHLSKDAVVIDCTLGSGGHATEIIKALGSKGIYIGIDADESALEDNSSLHTNTKAKVVLVKDNFRNIKTVLGTQNIEKVNAILADLGWRIEQFEGTKGAPRGFSFKKDEPLAMTFGSPSSYAFTAYDIVNDWKRKTLQMSSLPTVKTVSHEESHGRLLQHVNSNL